MLLTVCLIFRVHAVVSVVDLAVDCCIYTSSSPAKSELAGTRMVHPSGKTKHGPTGGIGRAHGFAALVWS